MGAALAVLATLIGVSWHPPSVERYTQVMNKCAAKIKPGQPTKNCSPEVASQAQDIAKDTSTVADATKDATHPNGQDVVYWIAPETERKSRRSRMSSIFARGVSPHRRKTVDHGSVTEAYAENATRITKQIPMEQKQCGFSASGAAEAATHTVG